MKSIILLASLLIGVFSYSEEFKVIIENSGSLSWSNSVSNAVYEVQWTSELGGEWKTNNPFERIQSSSNNISIPIPMYFRVIAKDADEISCLENLDTLDKAVAQWVLDNSMTNGSAVIKNDIIWYIHPDSTNSVFQCPSDGVYTLGPVGTKSSCSIHGTNESP